jgi:DNA-3-methyladenine glycosylase II
MQSSTKYFQYGQTEIDHLKAADPILGAAIDRVGMIRRAVDPDLFSSLMSSIVSQLISTKAARTIWGRIIQQVGEMTPHNLARQPAELIRSCGISMKKATNMLHIAELITAGTFDLEGLGQLPDDEVVNQLSSLPGVGKWTAEMMLIFSMQRPDVVSWGDLGIRRGMMKLYGLETMTKKQFDQYRLQYSPYGTVASLYLWEIS